MDNSIVFSKFVQGASHKPDKPCQDYASHLKSEEMNIIALSDGHGGKKYFRSQYGAKIAVEIAIETLQTVCRDLDFDTILGEKDFLQFPIEKEVGKDFSKTEYVMRHVFQHICSEWHARIENHMRNNPLDEQEISFLQREVENGKRLYDYYDLSDNYIRKNLPSAYGCTLFGIAETEKGFWIGFQIGDGKCVAFDENGKWSEPIPWDERCFQNMTTSLSHYDEESFRYCIGKKTPPAIFIASDGMDDSYAPMPELAFEYAINFMANLAINGEHYTEDKIESWLDTISSKYSRDDMSIGYIVKNAQLPKILNNYISLASEKLELSSDKLKSQEADLKNIYQEKQLLLEEKSEEIKGLKEDMEVLSKKVMEYQVQFDQIEDEIEKYKNASTKFSTRLKTKFKSVVLWKANNEISEMEIKKKELDMDLNSLFKKGEEMGGLLEEDEEKQRKLQTEFPVVKKHWIEASRQLELVESKLKRLQKVRDLLEKKQ